MTKSKNKIFWLLLAVFAMLLAAAGVTYAWVLQRAAMTTLLKIQPPDEITIIPVSETDGSGPIGLDLEFREGSNDTRDEETGRIHILRPVCIKSTNRIHRLEVVHTTNLQDLEFKIYPAEIIDPPILETNGIFTYDTEIALKGGYKNEKAAGFGLAKDENLDNYQQGDTVEAHAYPLYWIGVNCDQDNHGKDLNWQTVTSYEKTEFDPVTQTEKTYYSTYYYLEISWKETTKETDLFYIMAQNVAQ